MNSFSLWEQNNFPSEKTKQISSAQLISELEELNTQRKKILQRKDGFESYESQILEISIKLKKLEIEKNELLRKKDDLIEAKELAKKKNIEGKSNE